MSKGKGNYRDIVMYIYIIETPMKRKNGSSRKAIPELVEK